MPVRQPHLRAEHALWRSGKLLVVGIDEVGMGALCAPVFAAAVLVRPHTRKIAGVRDSKTLSRFQRTLEKVGEMASEGLRVVQEFNNRSGSQYPSGGMSH